MKHSDCETTLYDIVPSIPEGTGLPGIVNMVTGFVTQTHFHKQAWKVSIP